MAHFKHPVIPDPPIHGASTKEFPHDAGLGVTTNTKCDWRVNFRRMWGDVGLRRDTSVRDSDRPDRKIQFIEVAVELNL